MRGSEHAEAMVVAVDCEVNVRESKSAPDKAIQTIVGTIGRFNGKETTSYLEAGRNVDHGYPGGHRDVQIPSDRTPSIQAVCQNWMEFEGRFLKKYGFDDSLQLSKRDFMEWVESP